MQYVFQKIMKNCVIKKFFLEKIRILVQKIITVFATCTVFIICFASLFKNQRKFCKLRKVSLNIFSLKKYLHFFALLLIKGKNFVCFCFDHKEISFLHVCWSKTSEEQFFKMRNYTQSHQN